MAGSLAPAVPIRRLGRRGDMWLAWAWLLDCQALWCRPVVLPSCTSGRSFADAAAAFSLGENGRRGRRGELQIAT